MNKNSIVKYIVLAASLVDLLFIGQMIYAAYEFVFNSNVIMTSVQVLVASWVVIFASAVIGMTYSLTDI